MVNAWGAIIVGEVGLNGWTRRPRKSALALLVLGIGADDHHPAVATDHPAFVAHFLD
jgi:hypothetical protein